MNEAAEEFEGVGKPADATTGEPATGEAATDSATRETPDELGEGTAKQSWIETPNMFDGAFPPGLVDAKTVDQATTAENEAAFVLEAVDAVTTDMHKPNTTEVGDDYKTDLARRLTGMDTPNLFESAFPPGIVESPPKEGVPRRELSLFAKNLTVRVYFDGRRSEIKQRTLEGKLHEYEVTVNGKTYLITFHHGRFYMDVTGGVLPDGLEQLTTGKISIMAYEADCSQKPKPGTYRHANWPKVEGSVSYSPLKICILGEDVMQALELYQSIIDGKLQPVEQGGKTAEELEEELQLARHEITELERWRSGTADQDREINNLRCELSRVLHGAGGPVQGLKGLREIITQVIAYCRQQEKEAGEKSSELLAAEQCIQRLRQERAELHQDLDFSKDRIETLQHDLATANDAIHTVRCRLQLRPWYRRLSWLLFGLQNSDFKMS